MSNKILGLIYVTLFSLSWAIETIINKLALNKNIEPIAFSYQTLFGATILILTYILLKDPKSLTTINRNIYSKLILLGIVGKGITTLLVFYNLKYSTSINFGFIGTGSNPRFR